jgi:O-antigen/teichoic acid export membrane protein
MSTTVANRVGGTFGLPKSLHAFGVNIILLPLGIATSVLIARTVGPSGKGSLDLIIATAALLTMILGVSLPSGITFVIAQGKVDPNLLATQLIPVSILQALFAVSILSVLTFAGYSQTFLPNMGLWIIAGVACYVWVEIVARFWGSILAGRQQIAIVNNAELIGRVSQFFILFILAGALYLRGQQLSVAVLFLVSLSVNILISLILLKALKFRFHLSRNLNGLKAAAAFALPCYAANTAQFLNYRLDVFVVGFIAGATSVGRYTLAVSLGQLLWLMSNSVASVLLPKVAASNDVELNVRHTSRVSRLSLWATAVGALILALAATQAIPILYGEAFRPSVAALLWLLPGIVAFSVVNVLAAYLGGIGKPRLNLIVSCIALGVTVVLDLTLIPRLNIIGASMASTASYTLGAVLTVILFIRETGTPLREILVPSREDFRVLVSIARPIFRRARLQRA